MQKIKQSQMKMVSDLVSIMSAGYAIESLDDIAFSELPSGFDKSKGQLKLLIDAFGEDVQASKDTYVEGE